jgi:hypothetical protein
VNILLQAACMSHTLLQQELPTQKVLLSNIAPEDIGAQIQFHLQWTKCMLSGPVHKNWNL